MLTFVLIYQNCAKPEIADSGVQKSNYQLKADSFQVMEFGYSLNGPSFSAPGAIVDLATFDIDFSEIASSSCRLDQKTQKELKDLLFLAEICVDRAMLHCMMMVSPLMTLRSASGHAEIYPQTCAGGDHFCSKDLEIQLSLLTNRILENKLSYCSQ